MDVSYSWLRAVAPGLRSTPEEVARRLAARGAPVEGLDRPGGKLAAIRVARVRAVRKHPDADRLSLCDVATGEGEVQVVCGAPNVREGGLYPFAPVGATLPGGMAIKEVEIRGEASRGMLCSEKELGLGRSHEGLMELDGEFDVGSSLVSALGLDDVRLDVEVTPNRGDLLSHLGIARELLPEGNEGLRLPDIPGETAVELETERSAEEVTAAGVTIRIEDPDACHRYLGAVIRDVEVGPSPGWLQARLRGAGARPVNNVVDATNYVLLEMGQPLHAFDLDHVTRSTVVVRRASGGETIRTLDGVERKLDPEMLCICDADEPIAIAGVMGGKDSEVGGATTDVLLECALFEPRRIRATRMELGISTDASYRFERGVDPTAMETALGRAIELILATAGGRLERPVLDVHPRPWEGLEVPLRLRRVEEILGVAFSDAEVRSLLEPLGFELEEGPSADTLRVVVPGWRSRDVTREADVIEEVARSHGYDAFPAELGAYRPGTVPDHPLFVLEDRIRDHLVGRGFLEAQVPAFAPADGGEVALANPISAEESHLRSSLLPGLVRRVEGNFARGVRHVRLFELGTCFLRGENEGLPREEARLGLVATGARRPPHWSGASPAVDGWDLKGWLEELGGICLGAAEVAPGDGMGEPLDGFGFTLEGEGGEILGRGGRVRPGALEAPPWAGEVWALEITLPAEPKERGAPIYEEPSPFPGVSRDLALVIPDDLAAATVRETIVEAGGSHLRSVEVFDLYRGEGIPPGTRSVAFRLHFSSRERTLTDAEVDRAAASVVERLEEEFGVRPRS